VLVALWLRSPRKMAMLGWIALASVIVVIASEVFFPGGGFWREMQTVTAGFDDPTGSDRRDLWQTGWQVFLRSPLFGVGPINFGAYASENFEFGEAPGFYAWPGHLYGRSLHNIYVQVLSEQGLVGVAIFLFMLTDFVVRNRRLRTTRAMEYWETVTGGEVKLQFIALGLEAAMLGYLASGYFYDQLYVSSFYGVLAVNVLLHSVVVVHRAGPDVVAGPGGAWKSPKMTR